MGDFGILRGESILESDCIKLPKESLVHEVKTHNTFPLVHKIKTEKQGKVT
jgi:hypothetical protein